MCRTCYCTLKSTRIGHHLQPISNIEQRLNPEIHTSDRLLVVNYLQAMGGHLYIGRKLETDGSGISSPWQLRNLLSVYSVLVNLKCWGDPGTTGALLTWEVKKYEIIRSGWIIACISPRLAHFNGNECNAMNISWLPYGTSVQLKTCCLKRIK